MTTKDAKLGSQALAGAIKTLEASRNNALRYSAHLSNLLKEACSILEKMDVTVEVSEPLQCWWEKEKRKREAHVCALLSNSGVALRSGMGVESGVDQLQSGADQDSSKQQEPKSSIIISSK